MKLLTKAEAAERCRVSIACFDANIRPHLTPRRAGRRVLFLESDVAAARVRRLALSSVSRPSLRLGKSGTWHARYRINGQQREVSLKTRDEFEARVAAAAMHNRLSNLFKVDGPGVYLIRCGELMKIGKASRSIFQRLGALQTASAQQLLLLAVLSTNPDDEGAFHAAMAEFRSHGEWFVCSTDSLAAVADLIERGPR